MAKLCYVHLSQPPTLIFDSLYATIENLIHKLQKYTLLRLALFKELSICFSQAISSRSPDKCISSADVYLDINYYPVNRLISVSFLFYW